MRPRAALCTTSSSCFRSQQPECSEVHLWLGAFTGEAPCCSVHLCTLALADEPRDSLELFKPPLRMPSVISPIRIPS
eukprot:8399-Pelagomonas_calceolata.AAC.2